MHEEYIRKVPGSGMAVLLIHGIVGTPDHFKPFLSLFPDDWSVYNILLDGHGQDVKAFAQTSMEKWKDQVFSCLEEILQNSHRVMIIGHSMGCLFAVQAAVRYPDRVAQLFLLSIPLRLRIPLSTVMATMRIAFGKVRPQDTVARAMQQDGGVALEKGFWKYIPWTPRFIELLLEMRRTEKMLPRLAVPTEAYHGMQDELVSEGSCKVLEKKTQAMCIRLPDSGHFRYEGEDLSLLQNRLKALIEQYSQ